MDQLIQKFYEATITEEEERQLLCYFESDQVRKEHFKDQSLFLALHNRIAYTRSKWETPDFNQMLDEVTKNREREQEEDERVMQMITRYSNDSIVPKKNKWNFWISAAAIFLLLICLSYPLYRSMFNAPKEAREMTYEEYKKSMLLVSHKLNQGAEQVEKANKTLQKTQKLLQKSLILKPNEN
jgi:hypothetical protein